MAVYYLAKAQRDIGDSADSRRGMQHVADGGGRLALAANGEDGPAAPTIDPELVARRAAASMRLDGPKVASPRAAGTYVVGMTMWMWVTPSPTTFGPATASATAGGVTVTATAKVTRVRWATARPSPAVAPARRTPNPGK